MRSIAYRLLAPRSTDSVKEAMLRVVYKLSDRHTIMSNEAMPTEIISSTSVNAARRFRLIEVVLNSILRNESFHPLRTLTLGRVPGHLRHHLTHRGIVSTGNGHICDAYLTIIKNT